MVLAYIVCFVLAIATFLLTAKLGLSVRIAIALAVALIPAAALTAWVMRVGDKAPNDSNTIAPMPSPGVDTDKLHKKSGTPK